MRKSVLILFEESGAVRDAFQDLGYPAMSLDLLPSRGKYTDHHVITDAWAFINRGIMGWFAGVIAFPPCTKLCVSGNRYHAGTQGRADALAGIRLLMQLPVEHLAIENPVGVISSSIRRPDQTIQPYQFGHPESKRTCLWLKNLPLLQPTNILRLPDSGRWDNQTPSGQNKLGPSEHRARLRSQTYDGIAKAMAAQWGPIIFKNQ